MKQTLLDLITSKKFLAALAAIIIYVGGRLGFDIDPTVLDRIFAAFLVYVGAQGLADVGKSAALVDAAAPAAPMEEAPSTRSGIAATLGAGAILVLLGGITMQNACSGVKSAGNAIIDCTGGSGTGAIAEVVTTLAQWALPKTEGGCRTDAGFDWQCVESMAITKGEVIGGCALAELVTGGEPGSASGSAVASSTEGRATLEDFRSRIAGGAIFHTLHGNL